MHFPTVLDVLTQDYALVQNKEEYLLVDKHSRLCVGFTFSDRYARASGDRGSWHTICEFNSLEKNAIGLAAYLKENCINPLTVSQRCDYFTKIYTDLQKEKTDSGKQTIIQNAFLTQNWEDISCQSPNGKITVKIVASQPTSNNASKFILCALNGMNFKLFSFFEGNPRQYEFLFKKIVHIDNGLAFIEKVVTDTNTDPEFILQLLSIIITGRTTLVNA